MRLGELKKILDKVTDAEHRLIYESEQLYGGQLFRVNNFQPLLNALQILANMSWVKSDKSIVEQLTKTQAANAQTAEISPDEHNRLSAFINDLNSLLPAFYGILDTMVEKQDETVLNVMIPAQSLKDLKDLNKFNDDLQDALNLIIKYKGLRGDTKFLGFDVGTSWYGILVIGTPLVYAALLRAIKIAENLINLRKSWFESEDVRLNVEIKKEAMSASKTMQIEDNDIKDHVESLFKKTLRKEVRALIKQLPAEINDQNEMEISISKGIEKLIVLMEVGTEFHPSLNPPDYVNTNQANYSIDYEKLKTLLAASSSTPKIEGPTKEQGLGSSNE